MGPERRESLAGDAPCGVAGGLTAEASGGAPPAVNQREVKDRAESRPSLTAPIRPEERRRSLR
jgi:hypothetical protein